MTLAEYLQALRRGWVLIAALGLIGGMLAFLYAERQPVLYQASSTVLVSAEAAGSASDLAQGSTYIEKLVSSYAILARSEIVLDPVVEELGLDTTAGGLASAVQAEAPLDTVTINIRVSMTDPETAQAVADAVADQLAVAVSTVSPTINGSPAVIVSTIQQASVPSTPISPNTRMLVGLGLVLGLGLGVVLSLVRRLVGGRVDDAADVAVASATTPLVGQVIKAARRRTLPAAVLDDPRSAEAESVRSVAANLNWLGLHGGLRSLLVTSAVPGEGKSSIASSMSLILAENSSRVLLLDADLRAPSIHTYTGLDNGIGLSSVLIGDVSLETAVQPWGRPGLDVLTSGPIPPNPGQMLNSDALRLLIARATEHYEVVVVDSGPLMAVSDAVWLGHLVDGIFVVVRRNRTKMRLLARVLDGLESARTPAKGVIISRAKRGKRSHYSYGYGPAAAGRRRTSVERPDVG